VGGYIASVQQPLENKSNVFFFKMSGHAHFSEHTQFSVHAHFSEHTRFSGHAHLSGHAHINPQVISQKTETL
jgi:hypothetical protein